MKKITTLLTGILLTSLSSFLLYSCKKDFVEPTTVSEAVSVSDNITLIKLAVTGLSGPTSVKYPIGNLIDGNLSTIWSAETAPGVFLPNANSQIVTFRLDTTSLQTVSYIKIAFFTAGSATIKYNFDVQVSPDGTTGWVTVLTNQFSAGNMTLQTFDFPDTRGKYVRIIGHGNNGAYPKANSYTEVEIYGAAAGVVNSAKLTIDPAKVTANTSVSGFPPANTVDGNLSTAWKSTHSGTNDFAYITADLGSVRTIDLVKLAFPTGGDPNYMTAFEVFASPDNMKWTKVIVNSYSARPPYGGSLETFDFPDVLARYIRVFTYGHTGTSAPPQNNSLGELQVWAQPVSTGPCHIRQIVQVGGGGPPISRYGDFYYNASGSLDSVVFDKSNMNFYAHYDHYIYTQNASHQIVRMHAYGSSGQTMDTYYTWANGRIAKDSSHTNYTTPQSQDVRYINTVTYDSQGRIALERKRLESVTYDPNPTYHYQYDSTTYEYDANGNSTLYGTTDNDNKISLLRTDPFLQYITRDYSKNNLQTAKGYTAAGLPTGFVGGFSAGGYLPYVLFESNYQYSILYSCDL